LALIMHRLRQMSLFGSMLIRIETLIGFVNGPG
jgi:hypothetical protein